MFYIENALKFPTALPEGIEGFTIGNWRLRNRKIKILEQEMGKDDKKAKWTVMVYPLRKPCRLGRDNMNRTFVSYQGHGLKPFLSNGVNMAGDNNLDLAAMRDIAGMARVASSHIEKRGESDEMKSIPGVWVRKLQKTSNLVTGCHFSEGYTP